MRRLFRLVVRSPWLAAMLVVAVADYVLAAVRYAFKPSLAVRTRLLQRNARRVLRVFAYRVAAVGPVPQTGLLVCNHLSYLDILVLASLTPAVFVSKYEVRHWPLLGWFARLSGTIFVRRERRSDVGRITRKIQDVMREGHLIVLFPEGTSTNGREILPFKSSLLEPATGVDHELSAGCIAYAISEGSVEDDVCYWGDMTFFPHALNILTRPRIAARVRFSRVRNVDSDRKGLAQQLHSEVVRLKDEIRHE